MNLAKRWAILPETSAASLIILNFFTVYYSFSANKIEKMPDFSKFSLDFSR